MSAPKSSNRGVILVRVSMIAFATFLLHARAFGETKTFEGRVPDMGVSDAYVVALGTAGESFLTERLLRKTELKHALGVVYRLKGHGGIEPNRRIARALREFIDQTRQIDGVVEASAVWAMVDSLKALGYRGDKGDFEFLMKWARGEVPLDHVRCHYEESDRQATHYHLQQAAVEGLGLTGDPQVLAFLEKLLAKPPTTRHPGSFAAATKKAVRDCEEIQRVGIKEHFRGVRRKLKEKPGTR